MIGQYTILKMLARPEICYLRSGHRGGFAPESSICFVYVYTACSTIRQVCYFCDISAKQKQIPMNFGLNKPILVTQFSCNFHQLSIT